MRWEYADFAHYFARILMTMNPDGTNQKEYCGSNSYWPNTLFYAKPILGSTSQFVAVVSGHHGTCRSYPYQADAADSATPDSGVKKSVRGGSWNDRSYRATSSFRLAFPAWQQVYNVGFRPVILAE